MPNNITKQTSNLPANYDDEADALLEATRGHEKLLKFVKGKYKVGEDEVPLGTQYVCHASQLMYCWIKFADEKVVERRHGKAIEKWIPPERGELGDSDQSKWETGLDGKPKDPWSFQHLLPCENLESGEVVIFVTSSIGGKIATEEVVREYARRLKRKGTRALPIVKLASKEMPTKLWGNVPRPHFEVDGWEDAPAEGVNKSGPNELNDPIPF
jgi:hypothetical protein